MSLATTFNNAKAVSLLYNGVFWANWENIMAQEPLGVLCTEIVLNSKTTSFSDVVAGVNQAPIKAEGASVLRFGPRDGYDVTLTPNTYAIGFSTSDEMVQDDLRNTVARQPAVLAEIMANTILSTVYALINTAMTSATSPDGQVLISAAHTLAGTSGGTASNLLGTAADLTETSLESLIALMSETKNEDGAFQTLRPSALLVSNTVWGTARKIAGSATTTLQGVGESGNAMNAIANAYNLNVIASPRLADTDSTILFSDRSPIALGWRERVNLLPLKRDGDTYSYHQDVKARWVVKAVDWRGLVGTTGV